MSRCNPVTGISQSLGPMVRPVTLEVGSFNILVVDYRFLMVASFLATNSFIRDLGWG